MTSETTSMRCKLGQKKMVTLLSPRKCKCMRIGNTDIDLFTYKLKDSGKGMNTGRERHWRSYRQ